MIKFQDFKKMDIRIAEIKEAKDHPNADKLLVLKIDTGTEEKQVVAGIKGFYTPEEIVGKKVVAITNMEPAVIRGEESAGMVLMASGDDSMCFLVPEKESKSGNIIK